SQAWTDPAGRLAYVVRATHVAHAKFVYGGSAIRFRIAKAEQLAPAQIQSAEARNAGSALSRRVRIVQGIIVEVVVHGKQAEPSDVAVEAETDFVVLHFLSLASRRESVGSN